MFGNRERAKKAIAKRLPVPHDEFFELCAISTTGELSEGERERLREHLAGCSKCRQALADFEVAASIGAPLVASEIAASKRSAKDFLLDEARDCPPP